MPRPRTSTFPDSARAQFPPRTQPTFVRGPLQEPEAPPWSRPAGDLGRTLTLRAHYDALTGYGQLACGLTRELVRLGVPVQCFPMVKPWEPMEWGKAAQLSEVVRERIVERNEEGWELLMASPHHSPKESPSVILSMWESNRLPIGTVENLNRFQAIIVPSEWNQLSWDAAGVTRQIYKAGLPVSECFFADSPLPTKGPFTFGLACRRAHGGLRKGVREALTCFLSAVGDRRDVRFRLKIYPDCPQDDLPVDPRIEVTAAAFTEAQLVDWYRSLHVYVSTSHAEGFGLCQAQALAMGRPVVGCIGHAQAEYLAPDNCFEVDYDLVRAEQANPENGYYSGYVWVPRHDAIVEAMRRAIRNPDHAQALGEVAASKALGQFRWPRFAIGVLDALENEGLPVV